MSNGMHVPKEPAKHIREYDSRKTTEIMNHLHKKYDGAFEIIGRLGQSRGLPGDLWGVRSIEGSEAFTVTGNITAEGYIVKDSYYRIYIFPKYHEYVKGVVDKLLKEYTLNVNILKHKSYADSLKKDVSVQDIYCSINDNELFKAKLIVSFHETELKERLFNELAAELCNELAGARLNVWLTCCMEAADGQLMSTVYYVDEFYHASQKDKGFKRLNIPAMPERMESFNISNLSKRQAERLCCLIYLDSLTNNADMGCLYDILSFMLVFGYDDSKICERLPNDMIKEEWDVIIRQTLNDPYLSRLTIADYIDVNERTLPEGDVLYGHKAVCFMDEEKNAAVIFRGTYGDEEWLDNAEGMLKSDTRQQAAAKEYILRLRENKELGIKDIAAAGHSKGGNKAQYVTIVLQKDYVSRAISINGQGFSKEFIDRYSIQIKQRKDDIELLAERRDFVNCLGISIKETIYYEGRRGRHTKRYPYGQPIAYFHYPDALRGIDGEEGSVAEASIISEIVNAIIIKFLSDEKPDDVKKEMAMNIISLMMTEKTVTYAEIADSIRNLLLLFFELSAESDILDEMLPALLIKEADVLLATIGSMYSSDEEKEGESETLTKLIRNKLVFSIVTSSANLDNFQKFLKKTIKYLRNIINEVKYDPYVIDYLYKFFDSMFSYMKENSSAAGRLLAVKMEESFTKLRLNIYDKTHEELFEIGMDTSFAGGVKDFHDEDLIRYIDFSINVFKEGSPTENEIINRKIFIANKTIQLVDAIFEKADDCYAAKKGDFKSMSEYWRQIKQCLAIDLYLCSILEEEDIYADGRYMDNQEFLNAYTGILERVTHHISRLTSKGLFLYDVFKNNADIEEMKQVRTWMDKYLEEYNVVKLKYQALMREFEIHDSKKNFADFWNNNQELLEEEIHRKILGLQLLKMRKESLEDIEKKLMMQYHECTKRLPKAFAVPRIASQKRKRMLLEAEKINARMNTCRNCIFMAEADIERALKALEELKKFRRLS